MRKHFFKLCFMLIVTSVFLTSCSKEDNNVNDKAPSFIVYKNQTNNLKADALQAQYKDANKGINVNFYGIFDTDNNPTEIRTITYQKTNNDTIVNLIVNPISNKIESTYYSVKGVKSPIVIMFDYLNNVTTNVSVSFYKYDWENKKAELVYATQVETKNGATTGNPFYTSRKSAINYSQAIDAVLIALILAPPILVVGSVSAVVLGSLATAVTGTYGTYAIAAGVVIGLTKDVKANDFIPKNENYPINTPITNPVPVEVNPIPHLAIPSCVNTHITFDAEMDSSGVIAFISVSGGVAPYSYLVESGFQQSTVFSNKYKDGNYLLAVKDSKGCLNTKLIPLKRVTELKVGSSYRGGIIAYILKEGDVGYDPQKLHGLIAAPSDQTVTSNGMVGHIWGCFQVKFQGAYGTSIGTGNQNTIDIMAGCSTSYTAARICGDLELGGYNDWYLPSKDELEMLFKNKIAIGGFGLIGLTYWSSSQIDFEYAWTKEFIDNNNDPKYYKDSHAMVRAIRSF